MKAIYTYPLLILGIAIVLYSTVFIDVNIRLSILESTETTPNMNPRIMYTTALFILVGVSIVASIIEVIREAVFERKHLLWWQAIAVGGSYVVFFSGLSLRHVFQPDTALTMAIIFSVFINPFTTYFIFKGFIKNAA